MPFMKRNFGCFESVHIGFKRGSDHGCVSAFTNAVSSSDANGISDGIAVVLKNFDL